MNWQKWERLSPEKQVEALRAEYYITQANKLEPAYKNVAKSKQELELLRGCLDTEVVLLRAEIAALKEYERHTPVERKIMTSFVEQRSEITKTVKQIAEHSKRIPVLKEKIAAYRKLRADSRAFLKEQSGLLAGYIEDCLEIGEKPPNRQDIVDISNKLAGKLLDQGYSSDDIENDPEWLKFHAIICRTPGYVDRRLHVSRN